MTCRRAGKLCRIIPQLVRREFGKIKMGSLPGNMSRRKKWLIAAGALGLTALSALLITASVASKRFEPYVREQAIQYLRTRFNSDVELAALHVKLPKISTLKLYLTRGRGSEISVEGDGLAVRRKGRPGAPPMFAVRKF